MRPTGCLTLIIAGLAVWFLTQALGWTTLIILCVGMHIVASVLKLLFGTRRP